MLPKKLLLLVQATKHELHSIKSQCWDLQSGPRFQFLCVKLIQREKAPFGCNGNAKFS